MGKYGDGFDFHIDLDEATYKRVLAFSYFPTIMDAEFGVAMLESVQMLQLDAWRFMYDNFKAPTGQLEESLMYVVESPYEAWMGSELPYARRRDWGFSGMTDALGRYYPYDPGIYWAENTIAKDIRKIDNLFSDALLRTAYKLELGYP